SPVFNGDRRYLPFLKVLADSPVVWLLLFHTITSGEHILVEGRPCRCAPSPARHPGRFRQYAKFRYIMGTAIIPTSVPGNFPANFRSKRRGREFAVGELRSTNCAPQKRVKLLCGSDCTMVQWSDDLPSNGAQAVLARRI